MPWSAVVSRSDMPQLAAEGADVLRRIGWLSRTPEPFREAILSQAIWRVAAPDTEFVHLGDETGGLCAVARGLVEISFLNHPDTRLITLVHAGYWGGYRPLIGRPRYGSLAARTEVLWALVPQRNVERLLAENPGWWQHIVRLADDFFTASAEALVDLTRHKSLHRAAAVLLRLAGVRHLGPAALAAPAPISISQADVAAMAVMSRGTFNTVLADFVAQGLIRVSYRTIEVVRPNELRSLIDIDND